MFKKNYALFLHAFVLLQTRDWFLLVRSETEFRSASSAVSYYVLQSSASLSLLLKPVLTRELMLPCNLPISNEDPPLNTLNMVEVFPLSLSRLAHNNKHKHGSVFKLCSFTSYVKSTWSEPKPSELANILSAQIA